MKKLFIILMLFGIQGSFAQTTKKPNQLVIQDSQDTVLIVADTIPEFSGGSDSLWQFLRQNLTYPASLINRGNWQGSVVVEFIIDSLGKVCTPEIIVSLHPDIDKEALRVVSIMPDWKPGIHKGKPVSVYYMLPIRFVF